MSTMNGNPHYDDGKAAGVYYATRALETDADVIALAQTEATLALAYEQRTANLIAKLALNAQAFIAADIRLDSTSKAWNAVDDEILARLGLNGDAS